MARSPASSATSGARLGACVAALVLTVALGALDSWDRFGEALRSLWDIEASNVGDPLPTVRAASAWAADHQVAFYRGFRDLGSSFIYPPFAALCYLPFRGGDDADLPMSLTWVSRALWLTTLLAALFLSQHGKRRPIVGVGLVLAALLFYPGYRAIELNQASLVVGASLGLAMLLAAYDRPVLAALPVAFAAAFKPQIALLFLFAYWHRRSFTLAGVLALVGLGLISLVFAGVQNHLDYVTLVLPRLSAGYAFYPNQSLNGAILRLSGADYYGFAIAQPTALVRALVAGCVVAVVVAICLLLRRAARAGGELTVALAVGWMALTLVSPVSWEHHYLPTLFGLALLLRHGGRLGWPALLCAALAYPLLAVYLDIPHWHGAWVTLASSSMVFGLLLLLAAFVLGGLLVPARDQAR